MHKSFLSEISRFIPRKRIFTDELHRLAWGTDAGFYRMIPQIVIHPENEEEVSRLLAIADRFQVPVTFRAAGTSLSGQAISDSVLIVTGKNWEKYTVAPDALSITMQPGIIGERVNEILKPYGRKFPPDPASVKSAMVGGIVMNNASGMNCGTHANSAKTILAARIVFADGIVLDTADAESRTAFTRLKPGFIREIETLRDRVRNNPQLVKQIQYKYSIKNVMGLNIEPFITHHDPFDILLRLLVGSEGTLAFVSQVTMQTEYDFPHKASAMLYFNDIREACRAVVAMKRLKNAEGEWIVKGAELLDWKSLQSVSASQATTTASALWIEEEIGSGLTAVLTETKASTPQELKQNIDRITDTLSAFQTAKPVHFTDVPSEYSNYWAIRSGIFPSVGGMRRPGTTTLIEDVAFHIDDLPEATAELQELLARHGYDDACIYGHALEGNYHFIINQSFDTQEETDRYEALMNDVVRLVVDKYAGSLKAEHGTGRNMAPFVEYEWGSEAFEIMQAVKKLFDPKGLLNPGVIFNDDPRCYLKHFKPLPLFNPKVDKCIECGFCEVNCLTCGFTLSARQRIVLQREIALLKASGKESGRLHRLQKQYRYPGAQTCAGDGLCAMSCPMGINIGELTHDIRCTNHPPGSAGYAVGNWTAKHFSTVKSLLRAILFLANAAHTVLGTRVMTFLGKFMHKGFHFPLWTPAMPRPIFIENANDAKSADLRKKNFDIPPKGDNPLCKAVSKGRHGGLDPQSPYIGRSPSFPNEGDIPCVVYFPSCINQTMGLEKYSPEKRPLINEMVALLHKAGYTVIFPKNMQHLCCGTIWESKGMAEIADRKTAELEAALYEASDKGKYPVLCDQSPCLYRMRNKMTGIKLYEPVEFITTFLLDKLEFTQTNLPVVLHITCSMRKMGLDTQLIDLAKRCSSKVFVPEEVGCCGFAGDKGFTCPEVNVYALRKLRPQIEHAGITKGYSNSRTCETGLTTNSGIPYQSIVYLVNQSTN
jgi:D-lactate dehydrogenase